MQYYYITDPTSEKGFIEITETEWNSLFGNDATRPYATQVYRDELAIEEVPEELREAVQVIVDNRIARFGLYENRRISDSEALDIILGGDV